MSIFDLFKQIEKKEDTRPISFIIAGLGNPGLKYERTRHNAGFIAIDAVAKHFGAKIDKAKFNALIGECIVAGQRGILMKPQTFMNNSGVAIAEAAAFYKIPAERVLILFDEIAFEPGVMRIKRKGSAGGHNGLKSIAEHLGSEAYPRIKLGVGNKPRPDYDLADWVLGKFPESDLSAVCGRLDDVCASCELIVGGRIDDAMSRYSK